MEVEHFNYKSKLGNKRTLEHGTVMNLSNHFTGVTKNSY